jgi:AcrR family transcriptional regulator
VATIASSPPGASSPPARRRHGAELEDVLLSAAWSTLRRDGYEAFTIDAVARAAGTSRAVVYRRWPNRAALVYAAVQTHTETLKGHLPDTGDLTEDVLDVLTTLAGRIDVFGVDVITGLLSELDEIPDEMKTVVPNAFEELIDRARERGEIGSGTVPEAVLAMPGTLVRYSMIAERRAPNADALRRIADELFIPLIRHYAGAPESRRPHRSVIERERPLPSPTVAESEG